MKIVTLASIYIGSYEICMKIQELLPGKKQIHDVDQIRSRLDLGREVYENGRIGYKKVDELCEVLNEFNEISQSYRCDECLVFAGSTFKNASNMIFVLEQIRVRTGISIQVLSNSEQRALGYKVVSGMEDFPLLIQEGCVLIDVGGRSIQITVFDAGHMVFTKQVAIGSLRLLQALSLARSNEEKREKQILEMVEKEIVAFRSIYGNGRTPRHLIFMGQYLDEIFHNKLKSPKLLGMESGSDVKTVMPAGTFHEKIKNIYRSDMDALSDKYDFLNVNDPNFKPSMIMYDGLVRELQPEFIWITGFEMTDGIACDYALKKKILKNPHDYDDDILSSAREIAARYKCHEPHIKAMEKIAVAVFNASKKVNGMTVRDRLLLQTAVYLHDCGKYVSMADHADMSYHIIMGSEILGLTHSERQVIAFAVKYHKVEFAPYEELKDILNMEEYILVAKIAAILRLANALDRSHKQKIQELKVVLKEKQLVMTVDVTKNSVWEQIRFEQQADLFEQVFSLQPVLKEKRK